jgi:general secretion pathway protein K
MSMGLPQKEKSRGIALITVLLVVAFASIAAVALSSRLQLDIRRTENLLRSDQAWLHAQGIEDWARGVLKQDQEEGQIDHLLESWHSPLVAVPIEGGEVNARLIDQQGLFNLNSLLTKDQKPSALDVERFQRLLRLFDLEPELSSKLLDWMDENSNAMMPGGAEDETYQGRTPAYLSANRPLAHISELLLVEGFTPEIYERIAPYLCTLPGPVTINVNTAPTMVLMSLAEGIREEDARMLIEAREQTPFENMDEFLRHQALSGIAIKQDGLGLKSDYFEVKGGVHLGRARIGISSLLKRTEKDGVQVIQRMREGLFSG